MAAACLIALGLLASGRLLAQEGSWIAQHISDGDRMILGLKTVHEDGSAGIEAKPARLAGILCPVPGQRFSAYARSFTDVALRGKFLEAQVKILVNTSPRWVVVGNLSQIRVPPFCSHAVSSGTRSACTCTGGLPVPPAPPRPPLPLKALAGIVAYEPDSITPSLYPTRPPE